MMSAIPKPVGAATHTAAAYGGAQSAVYLPAGDSVIWLCVMCAAAQISVQTPKTIAYSLTTPKASWGQEIGMTQRNGAAAKPEGRHLPNPKNCPTACDQLLLSALIIRPPG